MEILQFLLEGDEFYQLMTIQEGSFEIILDPCVVRYCCYRCCAIIVWLGMVKYCIALYSIVWCGMVWYGMVCCGMLCYGMVGCIFLHCAWILVPESVSILPVIGVTEIE